jgi:predicted double-glycine peptidase
MKDKTNNTSAFSIFGAATATSATGDNSKSNSKVTSIVDITVDVAGLISKGKELLEDESLDSSSGKLKSFRALGKELLKDSPNLAEQFEQATNLSGVYRIVNSENMEAGIKQNQEASHKYAYEAVKRGIEFLEMLS